VQQFQKIQQLQKCQPEQPAIICYDSIHEQQQVSVPTNNTMAT